MQRVELEAAHADLRLVHRRRRCRGRSACRGTNVSYGWRNRNPRFSSASATPYCAPSTSCAWTVQCCGADPARRDSPRAESRRRRRPRSRTRRRCRSCSPPYGVMLTSSPIAKPHGPGSTVTSPRTLSPHAASKHSHNNRFIIALPDYRRSVRFTVTVAFSSACTRALEILVLARAQLDVELQLAVGARERALELRGPRCAAERLAMELRDLLVVHPQLGVDRLHARLGRAEVQHERRVGPAPPRCTTCAPSARSRRRTRPGHDAPAEEVASGSRGCLLARRLAELDAERPKIGLPRHEAWDHSRMSVRGTRPSRVAISAAALVPGEPSPTGSARRCSAPPTCHRPGPPTPGDPNARYRRPPADDTITVRTAACHPHAGRRSAPRHDPRRIGAGRRRGRDRRRTGATCPRPSLPSRRAPRAAARARPICASSSAVATCATR